MTSIIFRRAFILGVILTLPLAALGDGRFNRSPHASNATGYLDWSLIPPALTPDYVIFGSDGSLTIHDMPLSGVFLVSDGNMTIEATAWAILNADLDPVLDGPMYGPVWITATIGGEEILIFNGKFDGQSDFLWASGTITLQGRGPFAGAALTLDFLETGANTEVFDLNGQSFDPRRR